MHHSSLNGHSPHGGCSRVTVARFLLAERDEQGRQIRADAWQILLVVLVAGLGLWIGLVSGWAWLVTGSLLSLGFSAGSLWSRIVAGARFDIRAKLLAPEMDD